MQRLLFKGKGHVELSQDGRLSTKNARLSVFNFGNVFWIEVYHGAEVEVEERLPERQQWNIIMVTEKVHLVSSYPHAHFFSTDDQATLYVREPLHYETVHGSARHQSRLLFHPGARVYDTISFSAMDAAYLSLPVLARTVEGYITALEFSIVKCSHLGPLQVNASKDTNAILELTPL